MNIAFVDYDGVVNIAMWDEEGKHCRFNFPEDDKVNHFQAVQWLSHFCKKYDYKIVVTSTWRKWSNYKNCLINGGLSKNVEIIGKTDVLPLGTRGDEVNRYLSEHHDIENYIIFDDDNDFTKEQQEHLVLCDVDVGINMERFNVASRIHERFQNKKLAGGD